MNKKYAGGRRKKYARGVGEKNKICGGVREKIQICEGGSVKFSIPPPLRISNGIALTDI